MLYVLILTTSSHLLATPIQVMLVNLLLSHNLLFMALLQNKHVKMQDNKQ